MESEKLAYDKHLMGRVSGTMHDKYAPGSGLEVFSELLGKDAALNLAAAAKSGFGSRFSQQAIDYVFAEVWGNSPLPRRDLSLVTLGALVALRMGDEIANHVRIARANGLSSDEIDAAITHLAVYAGFPAASGALRVARQVLEEDRNTSQEGK